MSVDAGVPDNSPVAVLNVAHAGLLLIKKTSVLPLPPLAVGWKEYDCPTVTVVAGTPLIFGVETAARRLTVAFPDLVGSSVDTAVTVTVAGEGTVEGTV